MSRVIKSLSRYRDKVAAKDKIMTAPTDDDDQSYVVTLAMAAQVHSFILMNMLFHVVYKIVDLLVPSEK